MGWEGHRLTVALSHPAPSKSCSDQTGQFQAEQSCCLPGLCGVDPARHLETPVLGTVTCDTPPRDAISQIPGQAMDLLLEHGNLQL